MSETNSQILGDDDALLTSADVAEKYRVHKRNVAGLVKAGRIPKPVEGWTGGQHRWLRSEIVAHIRGMRHRELAEQVS